MTPPTDKPPEQPGSATAKPDDTPAPRAAQGAAPAAGGASVQSTIAAYRSLRTVSAAIVGAIERLEPKPTPLLLIADESELEGLSEYRAFTQAAQLYVGELRAIESELEPIPEDLAASMSVTAGVATLGDIISKVLVPLAPKFTFSDQPLSVENAALVRVVAGALASRGFTVFTSLSVLLRQGPSAQSELTAALAELGAAVRSALSVAAGIPEKRRPALVQRLTSISEAVAKLTDSLLTDPRAAQRILKGAALDRLLPDGLLVHLTVSAAGAQVYERAHLFRSSRKHSGGVVVTYVIYASDGAVRGGEALDALQVFQQEEIP